MKITQVHNHYFHYFHVDYVTFTMEITTTTNKTTHTFIKNFEYTLWTTLLQSGGCYKYYPMEQERIHYYRRKVMKIDDLTILQLRMDASCVLVHPLKLYKLVDNSCDSLCASDVEDPLVCIYDGAATIDQTGLCFPDI